MQRTSRKQFQDGGVTRLHFEADVGTHFPLLPRHHPLSHRGGASFITYHLLSMIYYLSFMIIFYYL